MNGPDHFDVNVYNDGTGYFAFFRDEDNFTATLPITFGAAPDRHRLLGAVGSIRRKITVQ